MPIRNNTRNTPEKNIFNERIRSSRVLSKSRDLLSNAWSGVSSNRYVSSLLNKLDSANPKKYYHKNFGQNNLPDNYLNTTKGDNSLNEWDKRQTKIHQTNRISSLQKGSERLVEKIRKREQLTERLERLRRRGYQNATITHRMTTIENNSPQSPVTGNISQKAQRLERKRSAPQHLRKNINISTRSNKSLNLKLGTKASKTLHKLAGSRTVRRGAIGLGLMFAASKVYNGITSLGNPSIIPEHYDKAYDAINDSLTDFGSPVKLWKTASKTITPYKSSVRRGTRTSVRQELESNMALKLADNAIGHMKY